MDIIGILISLNKISLVALVVTVGFLFYQIYLLKKETENKKKKLVIPDFKEGNATPFAQQSKILVPQEKQLYTKSSILPIIIGAVFLVIFGLIFVFGLLQSGAGRSQNPIPTAAVNFVASKGIAIYNQNWVRLADSMLKKIQPGEHIVVGIASVKGSDVDMARIRLNKNKWTQDDITYQFNRQMNLFYKEFVISTGESSLKFEAELHSKEDGWLGD